MATVEYRKLKNQIIQNTKLVNQGFNKFRVNYDSLSGVVEKDGLILIKTGLESEFVGEKDAIFLSEYFKGKKLSWLDEKKQYTTLVFVLKENVDDECQKLIEEIKTQEIDKPSVDHTRALTRILADYPCYYATIVSYISNDPFRIGKASYEIKCRANTVAIKQEQHKYNHKDMD